MSEKEQATLIKYYEFIEREQPSNEFLIEIIRLSGDYLNLTPIADYAKANDLSYNGARDHRPLVNLFSKNFIIDNE